MRIPSNLGKPAAGAVPGGIARYAGACPRVPASGRFPALVVAGCAVLLILVGGAGESALAEKDAKAEKEGVQENRTESGNAASWEGPPRGQTAPEWEVSDWMNGEKALSLAELKKAGKVVLVRWFTAQHCPYCSASAPALNEFHEKYADDGVQVIGFYHHKSSASLKVEEVWQTVKHYGYTFPVAIDRDWKTLQDWWLQYPNPRWTSVTFLLDREGIIRHIHPGGQYVKGDAAYAALEEKIREVVAE